MWCIIEERLTFLPTNFQQITYLTIPKFFDDRSECLHYIAKDLLPELGVCEVSKYWTQIQGKIIKIRDGQFVLINAKLKFKIFDIIKMFSPHPVPEIPQCLAQSYSALVVEQEKFKNAIVFSRLVKLFGESVYFFNGNQLTPACPIS